MISAFHFAEEIKLHAFAPNHHFDGNPSDNILSGTDFILDAECSCDPDLYLYFYPNPVSEYLNIGFNITGQLSNNEQFRIVNIQGQIIDKFELPSNNFNLEVPLGKYPMASIFSNT